MDFLDFIRKVHEERRERERFILKGGKGSGWYAPPKGTHGKGGKRSEVSEDRWKVAQHFEYEEYYEAAIWGSEHWKSWIESLSGDEKRSIQRYTRDGYKEINRVCRKGEPELQGFFVRNIDSALSRAKTPEDMVVSRLTERDLFQSLKAGDTFQDDGYVSVSIRKSVMPTGQEFFKRNYTACIFLPKGTRAGFLEDISIQAGETELLLARGSTFKVRKKTKNGIELILVSQS